MSPKFLNIEILFIYFLLLIPWPHTHVIKFLCSRDSSRLVRKIVRSKWTPILDKHHAKLPLECPFHPLRDVYAPRQDAKKRDRPTQWTCRLCGKSFFQEKFLDLHFEIRHKSVINQIEDSICLADYCDIMRCDVFQTEEASSLKFGDQQIVTDIEVWGQNSALAKANAAYLSLLPLRASAPSATRVANVQNRQLCQDNAETSARQTPTATTEANIIETGQKIKAKIDATLKKVTGVTSGGSSVVSDTGSGTGSSQTPQTQQSDSESPKPVLSTTDELNARNDTSNSTTVGSNSTAQEDIGNTTNAQKGRMPCKPEELSKLKAKCEAIVRGCIASLILSMSDKAFKEMEEEMNKAVCWYLTCDRYWEDGPLEPRAFPWGLIVILILALSIGICFCYYIIWILFDSEEMTINSQQQQHQQQQQMYGYMPQQLGHEYHDDYHDYHMTDPQQQQQHYYYQQQQQQQQQQGMSGSVHDLYPEQAQYDYRHSPRHHHYIGDQHQPGTPILGQQQQRHMDQHAGGARTTTPLHHHPTNLAYQQDILDRRDYTSSRPLATTAVTSSGSSMAINTTNVATGTPTATPSGSGSGSLSRMHMAAGEQLPGNRYNTHPRQLESRHRHVGASQQSLRASSSTHEIIQNEVGNNEHYIYVTYPPDLKKRFFEKYE